MPKLIFNGLLKDKTDVHIPVDDRSFRYGDGCFETIPFYNKRCFELSEHLNRLRLGLNELKIRIDLNTIENDIALLIQQIDYNDGFIRINCSRGSGSHGFLPNGECEPYYIIEITQRKDNFPQNITLFISDRPKISHKQLPIQAKINNGLNSVLARMEAVENSCFESLQLTLDGYISEGSSSNIAWFKDKILYMPSDECDILKGVTQTVLEKISPYNIEKGKYTIDHILEADEILLTNSAWEILHVNHIYKNDWAPKTNRTKTLSNTFRQYVRNRSK